MVTDKSIIFLYYWNLFHRYPEPTPEYRFHLDRKWRFDWAFLEQKVAVEVEGNAWRVPGGGRHMQDPDLEKYNNAALLGWRVFRFSPKMLKEKPEECVNMIKEALEAFK